MRSKYTNNAKNTSFVVGQYFNILRKYASSVIVGIFLAWNVNVDAGVDIADREAVVKECQMGVSSFGWIGAVDEVEVMPEGQLDNWSFVDAICARREARSLRRSVVGYEWISTGGVVEDDGAGCSGVM